MSGVWVPAGAGLAAFVLTALLVEPARRLALRFGLTDRPASHKAHRRPTPYLGGVAIVAGTLIPVAVVLRGQDDARLWAVVCPAVAIAVLGFADDTGGLSARVRLAVEVLLAAILVAAGARLGLPGPGWVDLALTVCWIVVVTNSFNLLDNADGALATVACVTAVPIAALLFAGGQPRLGLVMVCLAAACGGFLLHNAPPARIFMGDGGSLFLGLLLAAGATRLPVGHDRPAHLALLLLLVFPVAVDTGLVVLSRLLHRRSPFRGGTDHVAHRLRRLGLSGDAVLAVLLLTGAAGGLLAVFVSGGLLPGRASLLVATLAAVVLIGMLMLRDPGYRVRARPPVTASRHATVGAGRPRVARTHSRG
jgi:UDP-GlcNAc:undecaprenyl-phosphate GlcNAc-1-phosphate transferase